MGTPLAPAGELHVPCCSVPLRMAPPALTRAPATSPPNGPLSSMPWLTRHDVHSPLAPGEGLLSLALLSSGLREHGTFLPEALGPSPLEASSARCSPLCPPLSLISGINSCFLAVTVAFSYNASSPLEHFFCLAHLLSFSSTPLPFSLPVI